VATVPIHRTSMHRDIQSTLPISALGKSLVCFLSVEHQNISVLPDLAAFAIELP